MSGRPAAPDGGPARRALELLAALAPERSVAVLGALVVGGASTTDALVASTGRERQEVHRAVGALLAAGLVTRAGDRFAASPGVLRQAVEDAAAATPLGRVLAEFPAVRSSTSLGRVVSLPPSPRAARVLAEAVARALPRFDEATEPQLDAWLADIGDDVAGLRRLLVDEGLLERTSDGRRYWPSGRAVPPGP